MRVTVRGLSLLLVVLSLALSVGAQEAPPIQDAQTSAYYSFGQQATFSIEVSADAGIAALYLYQQVEGAERAEVIPISFEPGASVQVSHQRDLRLYPYPPFGQVTWWWEVWDGADRQLTTDQSTFRYVDNRFDWRTGSSGDVYIHAVVDDPVYVRAALDIAYESLAHIGQVLGGTSEGEINVFLYPSEADLRAALEMAGRQWVGGQAQPELGVVLVAVPRDDEYVARMERYIPHELTHLLVYRALGPEGYASVPPWLDEGLATASELRPDPGLDVLLERAWSDGQLIPLPDLCAEFSIDPEVALLSYAQSGSLVRYIRDRYGGAGIRALLAAYADGAGCEGGVIRALDTTLERLDLAWRADLMGLSSWSTWFSDNADWLLLWGLSIAVTLPMVGVLRRKNIS